MIKCELGFCALASAVLASELISEQDIGTRKSDDVLTACQGNVLEQSQDRGEPDFHTHGADLAVILFDDLDLPLKEKLHRFLPVNYKDRFKRSVKNQHVVHILNYIQ